MKHVVFYTVVAVLALAGCATTPETSQPQLSPEQQGVRARAALHAELGAGYFSRGQHEIALEELDEALRIDPRYAPAYNYRGLVYMDLKEDARAEQNFRQALQFDPSNSDANNNFGWYLCQRDRVTESYRYFETAVRNPLYANPDKSYVNAAVCALRANDLSRAEDYLAKALAIQPRNPQALFRMAGIKHRQGEYAAAKGYVDRLFKVVSGTAETLWLAVRVERKLGNRDAESSYALQLRNQFPGSDEARLLQRGQYE